MQLIILTIRPVLLIAVKSAAAYRFLNRHPRNENSSRLAYIRACCHAARRNFRLCRSLLDLGRSTRLLHANLHNLFNAALILQLNTLLFDVAVDVDLADVAFATSVLESDISGNSDYATDCAKVLSDLRSLTSRIRGDHEDTSPLTILETPAYSSEHNAVVQALSPTRHEPRDINGDLHHQSNEYHELLSWLQHDDRLV